MPAAAGIQSVFISVLSPPLKKPGFRPRIRSGAGSAPE